MFFIVLAASDTPAEAGPIQWQYYGSIGVPGVLAGPAYLTINTDSTPMACPGGGFYFPATAAFSFSGLTYTSGVGIGVPGASGSCYSGPGPRIYGIGALTGPVIPWPGGPSLFDLHPNRFYMEFVGNGPFVGLPTDAPDVYQFELLFLGGPTGSTLASGSFTAVPEPGALLLVGTGLAALAARRRFAKRP